MISKRHAEEKTWFSDSDMRNLLDDGELPIRVSIAKWRTVLAALKNNENFDFAFDSGNCALCHQAEEDAGAVNDDDICHSCPMDKYGFNCNDDGSPYEKFAVAAATNKDKAIDAAYDMLNALFIVEQKMMHDNPSYEFTPDDLTRMIASGSSYVDASIKKWETVVLAIKNDRPTSFALTGLNCGLCALADVMLSYLLINQNGAANVTSCDMCVLGKMGMACDSDASPFRYFVLCQWSDKSSRIYAAERMVTLLKFIKKYNLVQKTAPFKES